MCILKAYLLRGNHKISLHLARTLKNILLPKKAQKIYCRILCKITLKVYDLYKNVRLGRGSGRGHRMISPKDSSLKWVIGHSNMALVQFESWPWIPIGPHHTMVHFQPIDTPLSSSILTVQN